MGRLKGVVGARPACGMGMVCAGVAWHGCRDEPGGHQTWGTGTVHVGVRRGVLGMSLGAVHAWLRAMAHHAVKGA